MSLSIVCAIAVGAALLWAGTAKLLRPGPFALFITNGWPLSEWPHVRSGRITQVLARLVACSEIVLGIFAILVRGALPGLLVWLYIVTATIFLSLQYIGRSDTSCACFGRQSAKDAEIRDVERASATTVRILRPAWQGIRNSILCLLAAYPVWGTTSVGQQLALAASSPALLLAIGLTISIMRQRGVLRQPSKNRRYYDFAPDLAPLVILEYYRQRRVTWSLD